MAEKDFDILNQYGVKLVKSMRTRGAFACETDKGLFLLREYDGKEEKINKRAGLLDYLKNKGFEVDYFLKNNNDTYVACDADGVNYTLCNWTKKKECDIKGVHDLMSSVALLANLHNALKDCDICSNQEIQIARNLVKEYDKHNRELKMIRNYLTTKRKKNDFEIKALSNCETFLQEGYEAKDRLICSGYEEEYEGAISTNSYFHGSYNYHNILMDNTGCFLCGFEQSMINVQIVDLYMFMRKIMEKYDYDVKLGHMMFAEYNRVKELTDRDIKILSALFSYPEKFFKILSFYFNGNKAWIPSRYLEKLSIVVSQNNKRIDFINTII